MLVTRLLGFVRTALTARYFGVGAHADVWSASLRAPNILQNLLGEQTLSAAFIPIYSRLVEEGRERDAGRFAGAIFGLLLAAAGGFALLGILAARPIVAVFLAGFLGDADTAGAVDRFELSVRTVRILFPMTAVLVLSAWSLGVLNSHRRFFLPYVAPALWNLSMISTLIWVGEPLLREGIEAGSLDRLVIATCWGAFAGGLLQFAVQVPLVVRLMPGFRLSFSTRVGGVRQALRAFVPVLASRGVVQFSSYFEQFLASFLVAGAVGALDYAQRLYLLPIGLFAMSVAAAELPELSRLALDETGARADRVRRGLRQMAFLTLPTVLGYLVIGMSLVGLVYQRGSFGAADTWLVYLVLAGFTLGLFPSTSSRLLVNTFYSLGETKVPARIAVVRVCLAVAVGICLMWWLDGVRLGDWLPQVGSEHRLGAVGLALASATGAWLEWLLLYGALRRRLEGLELPWWPLLRMASWALVSVLVAGLVANRLELARVWAEGLVVLSLYAALYLGGAFLLRFPEPRAWFGKRP